MKYFEAQMHASYINIMWKRIWGKYKKVNIQD